MFWKMRFIFEVNELYKKDKYYPGSGCRTSDLSLTFNFIHDFRISQQEPAATVLPQ